LFKTWRIIIIRKHTSSSRWQGIFKALGFGRCETRGKAQSLKRHSLRLEPLEDRHLLSVLCWDPQQSGGANLGGSGTWTDGGAALWYNPATHIDVVWNNANGDTAAFQGKAGRVTVNSGVSAGSIGFSTQGYALSSGSINLTQNTTPGWTNGEIRVDSGADQISAVLGGSVGLTKTGTGVLTLTGASTYSGDTAIDNGTLAMAGGDNRLPIGTTVTLGDAANNTSGILQLGDGTTASNQTVTALTNATGYQYDASGNRVVGGGSGVATLTLNVAAGADYAFGGILGGSGDFQNNLTLTMIGLGTEELAGLNTYGGGTNLNAGVLQIRNDEALGTGAVTTAGGALRNLTPTSYYIDPAGLGGTPSDTNLGTIHSPLATLAAAYRLAKPGDTIVLRGGMYTMANLGYAPTTGGAPGAPLTIEAAPGELPIIDLAEWETTWKQDSNGYWYVNLPANSRVLNSPEVEIRNGAAATEILGDSVNGGPPAAFTQPDSRLYQNGQLAFDLTWYDTANQRLWFRSNEVQPITNPDIQCGVVSPDSQAFEFYGASWLVIKGIQIQNGYIGIHMASWNGRADHETVEDCRITNMWDQGILLYNSSYNEISYNYVDAIGGQLSDRGREWLYHDLYVAGEGDLIHDNFFGRAFCGFSIVILAENDVPTMNTVTTVVANNVCYGGLAGGVDIETSNVVITGNVIISPETLWRGSPPASSFTDDWHSGLNVQNVSGANNTITVSGNYIESAYQGVECMNYSSTPQTMQGLVLADNTIAAGLHDTIFGMLPAEMGSNQWGGGLTFSLSMALPELTNLSYNDFLAWAQNAGYGSLSAAMTTSLIDPTGYDAQLDAGLSLAQALATFRNYATAKVNGFAGVSASTLGGTSTPDVNGTSPQANNDAYGLDAGTTLVVDAAHGVLANDSDPDHQNLTAALVSGPAHGQLTFNSDGSFTYIPDANVSGQPDADQFTYMATDGLGGTAIATVMLRDDPTVNVTDAGGTYNGAPFPATATLTTPGNTPVASLGGVSPTLAYYVGSLTTAQVASATPLVGAPNTAGTYTVVATFPGNTEYAAASSNPLTFTITQASTTTAVSSSLNPSALQQSVTFTATVTPGSGTFDNSGTVQFAVDGTNFGVPAILNGGIATIQDSALGVGTHSITATYSGDSNFSTSSGTLNGGQVVVGPVSLSQSTIAVSSASIALNGATTVTLTARDALGRQELSGGLTVVFSLGTGTASGTFSAVTDNGNGTYTATFTGTKAGGSTIKATIGGQAVTATSPTLTVTPGAVSLSQSTISVSPATIAAGGKTTVTLTARDAYGNQETGGGLAVVFSLGTGSAGGNFSAIKDNGNGTYTATFTGTKTGSNTIQATIGGQVVTSVRPIVTVTAV
jgi:autotransporter-associated beta strand protein/parallel beta-helix repeat protein/VCBS repeat-containing protein